MNRLVFAMGVACAAGLSPVFAQSNPAMPSSVLVQPTTSFPSASIAQNFQYINHPPPVAPASAVTPSGGGRGHKRRQASSDSGNDGGS
ncbi:hypothetical protein [Paraburkholderia sp. BCC1884]|uniref:hypothetical protein n=1 Tax=Paraburkholderia sp. BCC1884 TaxID=2562668 RepID=UPI0011825362|nr:hypothetical protein [Paraburkholderia sp. BCC1884]